MLADPAVLILDDATGAIDVAVEERIHAALEARNAERTTILIAHRLSTIALADRVILLDDGVVAATGTHEHLLATNPRYAAILADTDRHDGADDDTGGGPLMFSMGGGPGGLTGGPSSMASNAAAGLPAADVPGELRARSSGSSSTNPSMTSPIAAGRSTNGTVNRSACFGSCVPTDGACWERSAWC